MGENSVVDSQQLKYLIKEMKVLVGAIHPIGMKKIIKEEFDQKNS